MTWFPPVGVVADVILTGLAPVWVFRNTKSRDDSVKRRKIVTGSRIVLNQRNGS